MLLLPIFTCLLNQINCHATVDGNVTGEERYLPNLKNKNPCQHLGNLRKTELEWNFKIFPPNTGVQDEMELPSTDIMQIILEFFPFHMN